MEFGLLIFLGIIGVWMRFTTPRTREFVFGYAVFLAVIMFVVSLITGQGPGSAYDYW